MKTEDNQGKEETKKNTKKETKNIEQNNYAIIL